MNNNCYEFYYEMMTDTERIVYRVMYEGLINSETIFSIPKCEYEKVGDIYSYSVKFPSWRIPYYSAV